MKWFGLVLALGASVLCAPAEAATWSLPTPADALQRADGTFEVPGGVAVMLEVPRGSVRVFDDLGNELVTRGMDGGVLVPAEGATRRLRVEAEAPVRVRFAVGRQERGAWEAWFLNADRAMRQGRPSEVAVGPWGGERLAAMVRLRAAAVDEPSVARLGLRHDVETVWPLGGWGHRATKPEEALASPGERVVSLVRGPGAALVRLTAGFPESGDLVRFTAFIDIDGDQWRVAPIAASAGVTRSTRVWVPPGVHEIGVRVEGAEIQVGIEPQMARARLFTSGRAPQTEGLAEAERQFLNGHVDAALVGFRPFVGAPGAAGALARARVALLTPDLDELMAVTASVPTDTPDARVVMADAVLHRADELPPDRVLQAVIAAPDADSALVASWLDRVSGARPLGVALLQLASADIGTGPSTAKAALRASTLDSRYTRLEPQGWEAQEMPGAVRVLRDSGPGVARVRLDERERVKVTLPIAPPDRYPVLRIRADGPAAFTLDDTSWNAWNGGEVDIGLMPGVHDLKVDAGSIVLLDADTVEGGGTRQYEFWLVPLPATFELPDPGVPVDLRVDVPDPNASVMAVYDDGRVERGYRDADGRVRLRAGSSATEVTLTGPAFAALAMRGPSPVADARTVAAADVEGALDQLSTWTASIDAGDPSARLARARVLASIGLLTWARRDLEPLLDDPSLERQARRLYDELPPIVPTAPVLGAWSVPAALAAAGVQEPAPADDLPLGQRIAQTEELAQRTGLPALWRAAAELRQEGGDVLGALVDAQLAGEHGGDLVPSLTLDLDWRSLPRADVSAGIVEVELERRPEVVDGDPVWRRARMAMFGLPWPEEEGLVLRGPASDRVRFEGSEVEVSLYCRDERLEGTGCTVPVRLDGATRQVEVADGERSVVRLSAGPGAHEVEVGPADDAHALGVRVAADGEVLPPAARRMALRATPGRSVELTVAGDAAVRVEVVRGSASVRVDGELAGTAAAGEELVAVLPVAAQVRVVVEGDADVLLARGEAAPAPELPPVVPGRAEPVVRLDELAVVMSRYANPPEPELALQSGTGTWEVGATGARERLAVPEEPWVSGELAAAWFRRDMGRWWLAARAFGRGPTEAAGVQVDGGPEWWRGFGGLSLEAAGSEGVADTAGHVSGALFGRQELPLAPDLALRGDARGWLGWFSDAPLANVDPKAWTSYDADHFAGTLASVSLVARPYRDVRLEGGARFGQNANFTPERAGPFVEADLLLGLYTAVLLDGSYELRFADDDRATAFWRPSAALTIDYSRWLSATTRLTLWGRVEPLPSPSLMPVYLGVKVLLSPNRGLDDLPAYDEVFRTARGAP